MVPEWNTPKVDYSSNVTSLFCFSAAQKSGSGALAGILSGIILSAVGAVSAYFAYQKKKLCFKQGNYNKQLAYWSIQTIFFQFDFEKRISIPNDLRDKFTLTWLLHKKLNPFFKFV